MPTYFLRYHQPAACALDPSCPQAYRIVYVHALVPAPARVPATFAIALLLLDYLSASRIEIMMNCTVDMMNATSSHYVGVTLLVGQTIPLITLKSPAKNKNPRARVTPRL